MKLSTRLADLLEWYNRAGCLIFFLLPFDWLFAPRRTIFDPFFILTSLWILFWTLQKTVQGKLSEASRPLNLQFLIVLIVFMGSIFHEPLALLPIINLSRWMEYAVLVIIAGDLAGNSNYRKVIVGGLVFSALFSASGGIFDFFNYLGRHHGWFYRARFNFESPNLLGDFLLLPISITTACFLSKKEKGAWFEITATILMLAAFALTLSRGSWIGLLFAFFVLGILSKNRKKLILFPLAPFFAAVAGLIFFLPHEALKRSKLFLFHMDLSARIRLDVWKSCLLMLKAHPLIGVGLGNFIASYPHYALPGAGSHYLFMPHAQQLYLQIAVETGLIGFLGFLWLLSGMIKTAYQAWKKLESTPDHPLALGILAGIVGYLVHGLFDYTLWYPRVGILFWTLVGIDTALWHQGINEKVSEAASDAKMS